MQILFQPKCLDGLANNYQDVTYIYFKSLKQIELSKQFRPNNILFSEVAWNIFRFIFSIYTKA